METAPFLGRNVGRFLVTALCWGLLACGPAELSYYAPEQAERGAVVYEASCSGCHQPDLSGGGLTAALGGPGILAAWAARGLTVDDLYYVVRASMPPGAPDSLSPDERLDVVAYLLQQNGLEPGNAPLRAEQVYLSELTFAATDPRPGAVPPEAPEFVEGTAGLQPTSSSPTAAELADAYSNDEDWLYHTGDYGGSRYSGLNQITTRNVASLAVTCRYTMSENGRSQNGPIVYQGVMYVTSLHQTVALDAATCEEWWTHTWDAPAGDVWPVNRGVALGSGRVVRATSDGYIIALDSETGALLWARKAARADQGETFTMPPLIWEDLVLVGPAGSENAIKGWIAAFSVEDGSPVWRFNIVPRPGEPGYDTWDHSQGFPLGGGATWTPLSMDADAGVVFVAATNPAPDFPAELRGGDNLYTNAAIALDARTGELIWYDQLVPADDHDWDLTQVSPVFSAFAGGQQRNLLGTVGKDGVFRLLDRDSHERLWETPVTTVENADAPVTVRGTHACPGVLGGVEWNGPAYNPATNLLYTPAVDWCGTFYAADTVRYVPGANYLGGTYTADPSLRGWVTAIRVESGEVAWRYESARPMVGAVTTTGGGLVFAGELSGSLIAFEALTGEVLAKIPTGAPIGGGVVTYEVDGRQFVAAAVGHPSPFWANDDSGRPTIVVLSLEGAG